MIALILAMSAVLSTWFLVVAMLTGVGLCVRRLGSRRRLLGGPEAALSFWLGWSILIGFLQVWHFWRPIGRVSWTLVACAGTVGLILSRREVASLLRGTWRRRKGMLLAGILISLWLANRAVGPCEWWDSRVYHLQVVDWSKAYAVIPGLGNLHDRLAFNNSNLLAAAWMAIGPWRWRVNHIANGVLLVVFAWQVIAATSRLIGPPRRRRPADAFALPLIFPIVYMAIRHPVSSLSTDLPIWLMCLAITWSIFRFLVRPSRAQGERRFVLLCVTALCAASVCVKLSAAPFAALAWLVMAAALLGRSRPLSRGDGAALAGSVVLGLALVGPWLVRGAYLSGYPLFPARLFALDVDWRIPPAVADVNYRFIRDYARFRSWEVLDVGGEGRSWLGGWLRETISEDRATLVAPLLLWLGVLGGSGAAQLLGRPRRCVGARAWWLLAAILPAVVVWFLTAPWGRFSLHLFWALPCMAVSTVAFPYLKALSRPVAVGGVCIWFAATLAIALASGPASFLTFEGRGLLGRARDTFLLPPGSDHGFHPTRRVRVDFHRTRHGVPVALPDLPPQRWRRLVFSTGGEIQIPIGEQRCWAPEMSFMTTPFYNPDLAWRKRGDPAHGFRIVPAPKKPAGGPADPGQ